MLRNYLRIAFRNLLKYKAYTIINALGLSIGLASCLFILVVVQYELSFDGYHENLDRLYRITDKMRVSESRELHLATTPLPWAKRMAEIYPEIDAFARYVWRSNSMLKLKGEYVSETIIYTDPGVFDVFSFPIVKGDAAAALIRPYTLVISEEMVEKYFDGQDPIGQTLLVNYDQEFEVTAVMKDIPTNSYIQNDFFGSFETLRARNDRFLNDWRGHGTQSFLLLKENASVEALEARFPEFIKAHIDEEYWDRYHPQLQSYGSIHLTAGLSNEWGETLPPMYLYIFAAIAVFVLAIACINFMNLATARSATRAREVGIRKVLGAFRMQLVRQFLSESVVISFIALLFAIVLVELAIPWFNGLTQREVSINYLENYLYTSALLGLTGLVGLLAGSYPAFFLSRFRPVAVLKGTFSTGRQGSRLRKILVVTQFSIAIFMISANLLLLKQISYMKNKDLGFDKEAIIYYSAPAENSPARQAVIKQELLRNPAIRAVFQSSSEPGDGSSPGRFLPEGTAEQDGVLLDNIAIDESYLSALAIPIQAGRNFSMAFPTDTSEAVIINETFAKRFGWEDPVGKRIEWLNGPPGKTSRTVVGVTRDFHYESLHDPIEPLVMHFTPKWFGRYFAKVDPGALAETNRFIADKWKGFIPDKPYSSYFLDVDLELDYRFEGIIADLLEKFTVLTVFIACLGLVGMASFTAERRTKEIGIRKVLGATLNSIILMLSTDFLKLVLLANLFAWPLAYFGMDAWLQGFAYHIDIGILSFLACGAVALLIAWLTVGYQAVKASMANPVDALHYE